MAHEQSGSSPRFHPPAPGPSTASRILIPLAAFVVVVAGLKAAVAIVVPFLMAVFLAIIATPALFWLKSKGINTGFSILIISLVLLIAGLLMGTLLAASIADFTGNMETYETKLQEWINSLSDPNDFMHGVFPESLETSITDSSDPRTPSPKTPESSGFRIKVRRQLHQFLSEGQESIQKYVHAGQIIKTIGDLLSQMGIILTNGFMIYLTMVFILLEASILPSKIKAALKNSPETYDNLSKIADNVKRYLALKTLLSLTTGILVTAWLMILNVDYAIVWGLVAFLLNFVPNIGSLIAAIPAVLLALLQFGPGIAILTALGYVVINVTIGNFIEPRLMGQRLGLSTLVVFLSLIFWGWVLGPMGMLLSVPLTMMVKIILQTHEDTRWVAILLGSESQPPQSKKKK